MVYTSAVAARSHRQGLCWDTLVRCACFASKAAAIGVTCSRKACRAQQHGQAHCNCYTAPAKWHLVGCWSPAWSCVCHCVSCPVHHLMMAALRGRGGQWTPLGAAEWGKAQGQLSPSAQPPPAAQAASASKQAELVADEQTLLSLPAAQEVVADDRTALAAVVAADVELMQLRTEEAELTARMNDVSLEEGAAEPSSQDRADDDADRLTAIYDRMQVPPPQHGEDAEGAELSTTSLVWRLSGRCVMNQKNKQKKAPGKVPSPVGWQLHSPAARTG